MTDKAIERASPKMTNETKRVVNGVSQLLNESVNFIGDTAEQYLNNTGNLIE